MATGQFRVGGHWGVTVIHDPTSWERRQDGEKTGTLWATAQSSEMAEMIVAALNLLHEVTSDEHA